MCLSQARPILNRQGKESTLVLPLLFYSTMVDFAWNIRLGQKWLPPSNAPSYYAKVQINKWKCFIARLLRKTEPSQRWRYYKFHNLGQPQQNFFKNSNSRINLDFSVKVTTEVKGIFSRKSDFAFGLQVTKQTIYFYTLKWVRLLQIRALKSDM